MRHIRSGARAVKYVRTFPPDKQPSLVHAYQRSYPEKAAKLTQQHVRWLREYEAELAGHDLPDAMHCLYRRARTYAYRMAIGKPADSALWLSLHMCCVLSFFQSWAITVHACVGWSIVPKQRRQHIDMWHLHSTAVLGICAWYRANCFVIVHSCLLLV